MECGISDARSEGFAYDGLPHPTHSALRAAPGGGKSAAESPTGNRPGEVSAAQAQALDQRLVAVGAVSPQVVEHAPPLAHQFEQSAARVVVLFMRLEVIGEPVDPLCENRDLDFGRTRVRLVGSMGSNRAGLCSFGNQTFALRKSRESGLLGREGSRAFGAVVYRVNQAGQPTAGPAGA